MQAVILAGGLGARLWPITKQVPKPMVPVAGVPYLEHQLRCLESQSIREIVLLTGYLGEQIEEHFRDGSRWGVSIRYSRESQPLGTGGGLRLARPLLASEFLVIYGDSFLPISYGEVFERLAGSRASGVIVVYNNALEDTSVRNNIAVDAAGYVSRYDKDALGDPDLCYVEAGVLAFRDSVVDLIPEGVVSLEKQIFPQLIARGALAAYPTRQRFYDIGTPERLEAIRRYFKK